MLQAGMNATGKQRSAWDKNTGRAGGWFGWAKAIRSRCESGPDFRKPSPYFSSVCEIKHVRTAPRTDT